MFREKAIKCCNSLFNKFAWTKLNVSENTATSISSAYKELFIDGEFTAGQHIGLVVPITGYDVRVDSGFYYNGTTNGAGAAKITAARSLTVYHPYYGGSQTTYSSLSVYAR